MHRPIFFLLFTDVNISLYILRLCACTKYMCRRICCLLPFPFSRTRKGPALKYLAYFAVLVPCHRREKSRAHAIAAAALDVYFEQVCITPLRAIHHGIVVNFVRCN